jgi:ABC-type transport system involved in multi-copper enzyme maturation permease subunit
MNLFIIALNTYREGIRKKLLLGLLLVSLLVIGSSMFLTVLSPGEEVKMIKDVCLTSISIFGMLIAVFTSASVIPAEIENKTIYTVLSKPLRRLEYLLGKFIGVQMIVLLNLGLMMVLFLVMLYARERVLSQVLIKSVFLTYFEMMILSSLTFIVSVVATSAALPTICGVFIYIVGHLVEYLKNLSERASHNSDAVSQAMSKIIKLFYYCLPNLSNYNLRQELIHLPPNDPTVDVRFWMLVSYALLCTVCAFVVTWWLFRRREL